jgi:hypothetical protein
MAARGTAEEQIKDYQATRSHMPAYCNLLEERRKIFRPHFVLIGSGPEESVHNS